MSTSVIPEAIAKRPTQPKLTASLLCSDAMRLSEELMKLEEAGIDYLHVDMADGHFVPILGIGLEESKCIRQNTGIPLDIHLLVSNPEMWVPRVLEELRPAIVTFQAESTFHGHRLVQTIQKEDVLAGVAINPGTPIAVLEYLLPVVDYVLLMTTNPGYMQQTLAAGMIKKIADLKKLISGKGLDTRIIADGNVSFDNAPSMVSAGADLLVCGSSSVFDKKRGDIVANTAALRQCMKESIMSKADNGSFGAIHGTHEMIKTNDEGRTSVSQIKHKAKRIVAEIDETLTQIDDAEVDRLIDELMRARRVFIFAVGRVLMSLRCFGKRLNHLGINCQMVGAMDEKRIGPDDLMLIASGSGESKLPAEIARITKTTGARLALITSASESTIKSISDVVVHLPCPTKNEPDRGVKSIQLMSTVFDQALHVFGDVMALQIQERKHLTFEQVWQHHANLE